MGYRERIYRFSNIPSFGVKTALVHTEIRSTCSFLKKKILFIILFIVSHTYTVHVYLSIYSRKIPLSRPRADNPVWRGSMCVWVSTMANSADRNSVRFVLISISCQYVLFPFYSQSSCRALFC